MAQETVIHRADAELAAGAPVAVIPGDLAADGIDELLAAFVQYDTAARPQKVAGLLAAAGGRAVSVVTPQRSWLLSLTTSGVRVDEPGTVLRARRCRAWRRTCCSGCGTAAGRASRPRATRRRSRCCAR
jgi:hypothetical protein